MRVLTIFLLFFTAAERTRCESLMIQRSPIKSCDFYELVRKSSVGFDEFNGTLTEAYNENAQFSALYRGMGKMEFSKVGETLGNMVDTFMRESVNYVVRHLVEYCDLAIRLMEEENSEYSENDVRAILKFPSDCVYCIVTAIHAGSRSNDSTLFEVVIFFRTIDPDDRFSKHGLMATLRLCRARLKTYYKLPKYSEPQSLSPDITMTDVIGRLREVAAAITNFSNIFCSRWAPLVGQGFLSKTALDRVKNQSRFIRHVFSNERCTITKGTISHKNIATGLDAYNHLPGDVWILDWTCNNILVENHVLSSRAKYEFSLADLKDTLKWDNFYPNALKYYYIARDVMFFASIKEGNKIIEGIKQVVRWTCSATHINENTMDTIRGMQPVLSTFKSVFDDFVELMKYDFAVRNKSEKQKFDERVSSIMRSLDVRDVVSTWQFCTLISEKFSDTYGTAYTPDNSVGVIKLKSYYFDEPLFHIGQLYRFNLFGI